MLMNTTDRVPTTADRDCVLLGQVQESLQQLGYQALRTLAVQVHQGSIAVQGQVPSYFLRQIALECIKRQAGVTRIVDRIEVVTVPDKCHDDELRRNACLVDKSMQFTLVTEHPVDRPPSPEKAEELPRFPLEHSLRPTVAS